MSLSTNEDVFKFLEFYQNEAVIWNPKHIHHKDKKKVHDAWVNISNEMEIPIPELKKKKEALMATFRQHLKKKKASMSSGCGEEDVYKPIWVFYTVMESFLGDVYECSSRLNTITQATDEQNDPCDDEEGQPSTSSNVNLQEGFLSPLNRMKRRSSNPPELQKASQHMQHALKTLDTLLTNKSTEDMCDLYGKLVASKLKKYFTETEQHEVMTEMDEILNKRIKNSLQQCPSSSLSSNNSSVTSPTPANMHHPSPTQSLYIPNSKNSYPVIKISKHKITMPSRSNQIKVLSDEVIKAAKANTTHDAFLKANDNTQ